MALDTSLGLSGIIANKIRITDNNLFLIEGDDDITAGDLLTVVNVHRERLSAEYKKKHAYYTGQHPILEKAAKESYKPDNRLMFNFPRKAVNSFNGFFVGTPVKIDSDDKETDKKIAAWMKQTDFDDVTAEVAKMASEYGQAYYLLFQDSEEDKDGRYQTLVAPQSPTHSFLIYDATFKQKVRYGVIYRKDTHNRLEITLYDSKGYYVYNETAAKNGYLNGGQGFTHPYGMVPLIEAPENEERIGLCDDVFTLVDAYDNALSAKSNDVDYFADAYLKITGAVVEKNDIAKIRDDRVINVANEGGGNADANFMVKPSADDTQEHLLNRLLDAMYQVSNVVNLNDDSFSGNISGVALQMKFQAMSDMAKVKALKFRKALRQIITGVSNAKDMGLDVSELKIKFTQTIPHNVTEEAQLVSQLYGKVPTKILLGQLSFITDPDKALEELRAEQNVNATGVSNLIQNAIGGADNGSNQAGDGAKNS